MTANNIDHIGFICRIEDGKAYVSLARASSCLSCAAKSLCAEGSTEKSSFEIPVKNNKWLPGDEVVVRMHTSRGFLALILAYLLPCIMVVTALLAAIGAGLSESVAGVLSLAILIPYYGSLRLFRKWMHRTFSLTIVKR